MRIRINNTAFLGPRAKYASHVVKNIYSTILKAERCFFSVLKFGSNPSSDPYLVNADLKRWLIDTFTTG
jgi:hypothetical protein